MKEKCHPIEKINVKLGNETDLNGMRIVQGILLDSVTYENGITRYVVMLPEKKFGLGCIKLNDQMHLGIKCQYACYRTVGYCSLHPDYIKKLQRRRLATLATHKWKKGEQW